MTSARRAGAATDVYTLRLNILAPGSSLHFTAFARYARALERRTNGRVKLELYANAQLAPEQETVGALISGVIDLAMSPTIYLQGLVPRLRAFDLPFLFRDAAAVFRVLDGPIGSDVFAELEAKGLVGLAWGGGGFREFGTTGRSISSPADMRGLRMRFQVSPIYTAMSQALGIIPVSVDISELFVALQQHTVDGADLVLDSYLAGKYYVTVTHIALSNHIFSTLPLIASRKKIETLPQDLQRALRDEGKLLQKYWRRLIDVRTAEAIEAMRAKGVQFTQVDFGAFQRAVEPVYAGARSAIGSDVLDRILHSK